MCINWVFYVYECDSPEIDYMILIVTSVGKRLTGIHLSFLRDFCFRQSLLALTAVAVLELWLYKT